MATMNSWANTISNAAVTLNGGNVNIGTDAAHIITIGSTAGAAQLALQYGTADFTVASGTGTVINALDTGEVTKPLQPMFHAYLSSTQSNATGDGTIVTLIFDTVVSNIGSNYNNANGKFTAPVTGIYLFNCVAFFTGIGSETTAQTRINTTPVILNGGYQSPGTAAAGGNLSLQCTLIKSLTAGDTAEGEAIITGGSKTVSILGTESCYFMGYLLG